MKVTNFSSEGMRILFLCHRFPYPPNSGANIRSFNMIRHLSRRHSVVVASLTRDDAERGNIEEFERHCAGVVTAPIGKTEAWVRTVLALPTLQPSSFGYFSSPTLARRVSGLAEEQQIDLVVAHSSSVGPYAAALAGVPKIIDFCDMDSQKWLAYRSCKPFPVSAGYWLEGLKLTRVERSLALNFDCSTCATPAELESLAEIAPRAKGDWFPNGVDLEFFQPSGVDYDADQICFVGRMDYFPNAQAMTRFVEEVFPLIRAKRPASKLVIVGASPTAEVRALARAEGVSVTGSVPDVRPYFAASACSVAPLTLARGTQNKILESLAMGVPVVASRLAARGLDAVAGEHLLAADAPADVAEEVCSLMDDTEKRWRFAFAGRARMESHHNWAGAMSKFDRIVAETMGAHSQRGRPARADSSPGAEVLGARSGSA